MIEILFEDPYILCVTKPNNVLVHHAYHSRNVSEEKSLLQLLDEQIGGKFYPIHRLDRKTSGIILLAKETKYVAKFQELFTEKNITKTYLAIARGHSVESRTIDTPVKGRDANVYKDAETQLTTLQQITLEIPVKPYKTSRYSLVKLIPRTGRLHQLRIHCNKISHPIIGDPKYGDKNHNIMFENQFNCKNLFLHARSLEFVHPFSNEKQSLVSSFPNDWKSILREFNWTTLI